MSDMRTEHALAIVRGQLRRVPADALEAAVVLEASAGIAPDRALDLGRATVKAARHGSRDRGLLPSVTQLMATANDETVTARLVALLAFIALLASLGSGAITAWRAAMVVGFALQGLLFRRYVTGQDRLGIVRRYPMGVARRRGGRGRVRDGARRRPTAGRGTARHLDRRHRGGRARLGTRLHRARGGALGRPAHQPALTDQRGDRRCDRNRGARRRGRAHHDPFRPPTLLVVACLLLVDRGQWFRPADLDAPHHVDESLAAGRRRTPRARARSGRRGRRATSTGSGTSHPGSSRRPSSTRTRPTPLAESCTKCSAERRCVSAAPGSRR